MKLKNYDIYLQRLELYIKASRLKLVYAPEIGEGAYVPSSRTIRIDPDLSESEEIATILHEIGHSIDDTLVSGTQETRLEAAYRLVYKKKGSETHNTLVYECEERAWKFGRGVAKRLHIPLGNWFNRCEKEGLKAYKEELDNEAA